MNHWMGRLATLGVMAGCIVTAPLVVRADDAPSNDAPPKKKKATDVRADKLGAIGGILLGEDRGHFYPFVLEVVNDSPAYYAGIRKGDEIVRIQDEPVRDLRSAQRLARDLRPGSRVKLYLRRAGLNLATEFNMPRPEDLAAPKKTNDPDEEKAAKDGDDKPKKKKRRSVIVKPLPPNQ